MSAAAPPEVEGPRDPEVHVEEWVIRVAEADVRGTTAPSVAELMEHMHVGGRTVRPITATERLRRTARDPAVASLLEAFQAIFLGFFLVIFMDFFLTVFQDDLHGRLC